MSHFLFVVALIGLAIVFPPILFLYLVFIAAMLKK
jgi:hypothetical protein